MSSEGMQSHSIMIRDRKRAELSGISEVENFNDTEIDLLCAAGAVVIEGESLKIESFSVETGKIEIVGCITGVFYYEKSDRSGVRRGLFTRRQK